MYVLRLTDTTRKAKRTADRHCATGLQTHGRPSGEVRPPHKQQALREIARRRP